VTHDRRVGDDDHPDRMTKLHPVTNPACESFQERAGVVPDARVEPEPEAGSARRDHAPLPAAVGWTVLDEEFARRVVHRASFEPRRRAAIPEPGARIAPRRAQRPQSFAVFPARAKFRERAASIMIWKRDIVQAPSNATEGSRGDSVRSTRTPVLERR